MKNRRAKKINGHGKRKFSFTGSRIGELFGVERKSSLNLWEKLTGMAIKENIFPSNGHYYD